MWLLLHWVLNGLALLIVAHVVPGVAVRDPVTALVAAVLLGLANAVIKPVLVLLTLPVTILTLGLFVIILNALLFGLSFAILQGVMNVHFALGFVQILIGYLIYVIVSTVLTHLVR